MDILLDVNPETTANLSPSVESVAGSARAEGSVYLQRFPLAVNSKELSLYAEVLDTVIDFRLRFGLFWWRIQYSQRARGSAKTQASRNGAYHFKELGVRVLCSEAAISKLSIFARDLTIRFDCIRTLGRGVSLTAGVGNSREVPLVDTQYLQVNLVRP